MQSDQAAPTPAAGAPLLSRLSETGGLHPQPSGFGAPAPSYPASSLKKSTFSRRWRFGWARSRAAWLRRRPRRGASGFVECRRQLPSVRASARHDRSFLPSRPGAVGRPGARLTRAGPGFWKVGSSPGAGLARGEPCRGGARVGPSAARARERAGAAGPADRGTRASPPRAGRRRCCRGVAASRPRPPGARRDRSASAPRGARGRVGLDPARAADRRAGGRRQGQPRDRPAAVPEHQDRRDSPGRRLPQAGRERAHGPERRGRRTATPVARAHPGRDRSSDERIPIRRGEFRGRYRDNQGISPYRNWGRSGKLSSCRNTSSRTATSPRNARSQSRRGRVS